MFTDCSLAGWQWLVETPDANIWASAFAVYITLVTKVLFSIAKRCILALNEKYPHNISEKVIELAEKSHSPEGLLWKLVKLFFGGLWTGRIRLGSPPSSWFTFPSWNSVMASLEALWARRRDIPGGLSITLIVAAVFVGPIIAAVFSSKVISDSVALSQGHPNCGIVYSNDSFDPSSKNPHAAAWHEYYVKIETESGEHAQKCYNTTASVDGCDFFNERSIPVITSHNDACPFKGDFGYLCRDGPNSAFTMSTGPVRPGAIGIHTPLSDYTFVRQVICSPLLTDSTFVKPNKTKNGTPGWRYFYGNRGKCSPEFSNCSFELSSLEKPRLKSGYSLMYVSPTFYTIVKLNS
jgi:hypothetical protein